MNIGAIKKMWVFKPDEISVDFTKSFDLCVVNVNSNLDNFIFDFFRQTTGVNITKEDDDHSGIWKIELWGHVSNTNLKSRQITSTIMSHCVIIVETYSGIKYLLGLPENPLRPANIKRTNPEKINDSSFYAFNLIGNSIFEPPVIEQIF